MKARKSRESGRERIQFWGASGLQGVRVLSVANSWHRWSLFHEAYALTVANAGHGRWRYQGLYRDIRPNTMMLIEPGDVHVTTRVDAPASFDTLVLDASLVAAVAERSSLPGGFPHFSQADSSDVALLASFRRVHELLRDTQSETLEQGEAFEEALFDLFRGACELSPDQPTLERSKLKRVRDLLHASCAGPDSAAAMTVPELADGVGLSPIQLIRGYKQLYGLPPYQYLIRLRLARAQRLIELGPNEELRSLSDVAQEVGFFDLAHMDKHFRRMLRMSPTAYAVGLGTHPLGVAARRQR